MRRAALGSLIPDKQPAASVPFYARQSAEWIAERRGPRRLTAQPPETRFLSLPGYCVTVRNALWVQKF